jgi:hypothetical protein
MMKLKILLILLVATPCFVQAQSLKKKYLGLYQGQIPAFKMSVGEQVVQIPETNISIQLNADQTALESLNTLSENAYFSIEKEDKQRIVLQVKFASTNIVHSYIVYKKEKRLERKGIYPQPDVFLMQKKQ